MRDNLTFAFQPSSAAFHRRFYSSVVHERSLPRHGGGTLSISIRYSGPMRASTSGNFRIVRQWKEWPNTVGDGQTPRQQPISGGGNETSDGCATRQPSVRQRWPVADRATPQGCASFMRTPEPRPAQFQLGHTCRFLPTSEVSGRRKGMIRSTAQTVPAIAFSLIR